MKKIKTIFIVGPTASGKTGLGIKLARSFNGEVISADSMQIYKGIEIASAAPSIAEREGIVHHLISIREKNRQYSVCDFVNDANEILKDIISRNKVPFCVGGTGLYIDSFSQNIDFGESTKNEIVTKLQSRFINDGIEPLLKELETVDYASFLKLNKNDTKRIIHALAVYYSTGRTITERNILSKNSEKNIDPLFIGLTFFDRENLYRRINDRVDLMIKNGLLEEAKASYELKDNKAAAFAIGHKEFFPFFNGEISLEQAIDNLKQKTRNYAKRQLTWFRKNKQINWIYADKCVPYDSAFELCRQFLERK